jgi:putative transposase
MPKGLVRYQESGTFHFLTFSCYRRLPLLGNATAYAVFEQELEFVRQRFEFVIAGYVLMPEHVHLLVSEPRSVSLATALQVLKQQTSKRLKPPKNFNSGSDVTTISMYGTKTRPRRSSAICIETR